MDDKSREKQKRRLKQSILRTPSEEEMAQEKSIRELTASADVQEDLNKLRIRRIRKILIRILICGIIIFGVFFTWNYYQDNYRYEEYSVLWSQEMKEGSFSGYETFGENVIKYTRDGASYLSTAGESIWTSTYEMKTPIIAVSDGHAVIADQKGNQIYIFNKEGNTGIATTNLPIIKADISSQGVVAVILEDVTASFIHFYANDGTRLDIEKKTLLSGDGYPIDISISPGGHQLMVSIVKLDQGVMQNYVLFYDFSDKGKGNPNRLVAGFPYYQTTMFPKVHFLSNSNACAFGDNKLVFYSLKNELLPTDKEIELEQEVASIFYNSNYVGLIMNNPEGEKQYRMVLYTAGGSVVFDTEFSFEYTKVDLGSNWIMLSNATDCLIYNLKGREKFSGTFDFEILKLVERELPGHLIAISPNDMKELKLK